MSRSQPQPVPVLPLPKHGRKKAVEDQIRALPTVGSAECRNYVRVLGGGLFPETLVWLFRAAQYRDPDLVEAVMERLLGRADQNGRFAKSVRLVLWKDEVPRWWLELESYLMRCARNWGLKADPDDVDEFRALTYVHVLNKLRLGAEAMPFWEVYFSSALHYAAIDAYRKMERGRDIPFRLNPGTTPADPSDLPHSGLSTDQIERRALALEEALLSLPERERVVVELLYMDPTAPNGKRTQKEVANILGVRERTVYNCLRRVRARLKDDPRLAEIRELNAMADRSDSQLRTGEGVEATYE